MPKVFLTGANRGIGLGFAKVYLEAGWRVIAAVRNPDAWGEQAKKRDDGES
ncbi:MAG: SDR family NAD(P)-dependent oxidoreductase [Rhodospirillaceae bacterium]|nr:SDR family NAD(P)-dependent oxidoreductase [Rhodospirillaceae bacterium]